MAKNPSAVRSGRRQRRSPRGVRCSAILIGCAFALMGGLDGRMNASPLGDVGALFEGQLRPTVEGLLALADPSTGLPYDVGTITSAGIVVKDRKTSPTNIGMFMAALIAARDRGVLTAADVEGRLLRIVDSLERMEKWEGFFYNWYDLGSLNASGAPAVGAGSVDPSARRFVSSVDNANLTAAMMLCVAALPESGVPDRLSLLIQAQDYARFLRVSPDSSSVAPRMTHGVYADTQAFSNYDYGTFMTEARLLTFLALVQDQVPHYPWASRTDEPGYMDAIVKTCGIATGSEAAGARVPVVGSWGGSLFEELFPDLFLDERRYSSVLAENHRRAVAVQIDRRNEATGLWGWSPAQGACCVYKEAGVACLAVGPGYPLGDVSPYSLLLAARYAPEWAALTLARMRELVPSAFDPRLGYCDSVAQDGSRYCSDVLALDRGIEVVALATVLQDFAGAPGISQYFWQYLDESAAGGAGRTLLGELRFAPDWQLIPPPAECTSHDRSISVLELLGAAGEGGGAGGCMNGVCNQFSWTDSGPAELRYDVSAPGAFAYYAALSLDSRSEKTPVDVTKYQVLRVRFRGDAERPSRFKVELKCAGRMMQTIIVDNVPAEWRVETFELDTDVYQAVDEIAVVVEHSSAIADCEGSLSGRIFIDALTLECL